MNTKIVYSTFLLALFVFILQTESVCAIRCSNDADCGENGVCENGTCLMNVDCRNNYDCVRYGIYQECQDYQCVKSSYHLCKTDADCPSPVYNKCKNYQCKF